MKETDKAQPVSTPPTTGNEPLQPAPAGEQKPVVNPSETPEEDEGFVVVGSGLGIDE